MFESCLRNYNVRKANNQGFSDVFVYTPVQGSDSKAQIYRVSHNMAHPINQGDNSLVL